MIDTYAEAQLICLEYQYNFVIPTKDADPKSPVSREVDWDSMKSGEIVLSEFITEHWMNWRL